MQTECGKWGNSLGVRIPKAMAQSLGLEAGSLAEMEVKNGVLMVRPVKARPQLDDLLESLKTAGGREEEIHFGPEMGREALPW